ncbi:MAG: cytochrome c3 family protein [Chloroflexi bacterium]|nr:cytochrome c3 family protein [Chloroflexota bacterium]
MLVVGYIIWSWWALPPKVFGLGAAPDQPIAFPHTVHVQPDKAGLDCQFCHRTVAEDAVASVPAVQQCMYCHKVVEGSTELAQAEIDKLQQVAQAGEPINWRRVHRLPDHTQFVHEPHVRFFTQQGLGTAQTCATCHGDVGAMVKLEQVRSLKMGDCVDCHRQYSAPTDCATCHY